MSKHYKVLPFLLIINLSCTDNKFSKHQAVNTVSNVAPVAQLGKGQASLLKYTSGIRSILHDSKGNYWFGSHQEGVCLFDGKTYTYFTSKDGLIDNQVRTIQEDESGVIWFSTANGLCNYTDGKINNRDFKNALGVKIQVEESNWTIDKNDLWFNGADRLGVYRYNGHKLSYMPFPASTVGKNEALGVTGFTKGQNNTIWIATYSAVFGFNGKTINTIDNESLDFNEETGFLHVRSIFEDSKGRLWIGNNGIGVLLMENGEIQNFSAQNSLIHFNSTKSGGLSPAGTLEHVFAIAEDAAGNIWFGDRDNGAWVYDGKSLKNYSIDSKLKSQHIWAIYMDKNKDMLFAMSAGGVYKYNGKEFDRKF